MFRMSLDLRPMRPSDAYDVYEVSTNALHDSPEEREHVQNRTAEEVQQRIDRYGHLLEHDPNGSWVAVDGERVVGVALALVREEVWILSLFAVDEEYRGHRIGHNLLRHALEYADGCTGGMICSSTHPAAMRRYARAGFALHPTLMASGTVSKNYIPKSLSVRDGNKQDLALAAEVDRALRGAAHGPDLEHLLEIDNHLLVSENGLGRGYAVTHKGSPNIVAATNPEIASELLWACLARADGEVEVRWITALQNWAIPVVLEAGLSLSPAGPVCTRGNLGSLTPYLPSGPFL